MVHFRGQFRETTAEPLSPWVPPPETVGRLFSSRYRIIHKIGDGATGAVFRAEDIGARESVALKIFRPELSAEPAFVEALQARIRESLELSARAAGALAPFVDVIDIGKSPEGLVFAVMPYVSGEDFATLLRRSGPVPWAQARGLFVRMCETLDAYHRAGRIHGFLQSRRCLLIDGPAIRILDTGVDRYLTGAGQGPLLDAIAPALARYAAPEQADGGALTPATDVYSLAVIFYELLTARLPFEDSSPNRMLAMHMLAEVPAPRAVAPTLGIPEAVEALLLRALAKRPEERFASMAALAEAISAISTEGATAARVDAVQARPATPVRRVKVHEIEG
ncbi:MAG: serine/threonine protein kinase, partial [Myxococcales bacterium]|nr:serine/threonine protein kinase [Myxococcales bacterium]